MGLYTPTPQTSTENHMAPVQPSAPEMSYSAKSWKLELASTSAGPYQPVAEMSVSASMSADMKKELSKQKTAAANVLPGAFVCIFDLFSFHV